MNLKEFYAQNSTAVNMVWFGLVLVLVGGSLRRSSVKSQKVCTYATEGVFSDFHIELKGRSNNNTNRRRTETFYYPLYRYEYRGATYYTRSSTGRGTPYVKNHSVTILLNPENPQEAIIAGEQTKDNILLTLSFIAGLVLLVVGIAGYFLKWFENCYKKQLHIKCVSCFYVI